MLDVKNLDFEQNLDLNFPLKDTLKDEIISLYKKQGLALNDNGVSHKNPDKNILRCIHQIKRREEIIKHKKFILDNFDLAKSYSISGSEIDPENIQLELKEVRSNTCDSKLFLWWNLIWWSLPYERPVGRQMRFLLWDTYHDAPFGLVGLQSPILSSSVRDNYLKINSTEKDYWINQSLYGQRIGPLPPYNQLLGGKMVALSLTCDELRKSYEKKYSGRDTILKQRSIPNRLLFISTTSAFGKSSMYERITYNNQRMCKFIGYTSGAGTFQLSEEIYQKCLTFLEENGYDTKRGYGTGPSRKLKLISVAMSMLGIPNYHYHNIKRGFYLFPLTQNLCEVIHKNQEPNYYSHSFEELSQYWLKRWCIPRSSRKLDWINYNANNYFEKTMSELERLS